MLELTLRLVFSLAVVLGLLLLIAKISSRRFKGQHDSLVRVIHRQPLMRLLPLHRPFGRDAAPTTQFDFRARC